jgi:3-ketoacyl-CoA synthase
LSKDLVSHVTDALNMNLTRLGALVLPYSEQFKFIANMFVRKVLRRRVKPYVPDFKKSFHHYCIHAGGRAVIDGLEKALNLQRHQILPSRAALWCFGNTSSASIWYELAFTERHISISRGEHVWQIAFGSGISCNSAVWTALRPIYDTRRMEWRIGDLLAELDRVEEKSRLPKG